MIFCACAELHARTLEFDHTHTALLSLYVCQLNKTRAYVPMCHVCKCRARRRACTCSRTCTHACVCLHADVMRHFPNATHTCDLWFVCQSPFVSTICSSNRIWVIISLVFWWRPVLATKTFQVFETWFCFKFNFFSSVRYNIASISVARHQPERGCSFKKLLSKTIENQLIMLSTIFPNVFELGKVKLGQLILFIFYCNSVIMRNLDLINFNLLLSWQVSTILFGCFENWNRHCLRVHSHSHRHTHTHISHMLFFSF